MEKKFYQTYIENKIQGASREEILLLLYEALIRFLKLAIKFLEEKKQAEAGQYILKSMDIVLELNQSLNHDIGGQISQDLERLYIFVMDQLTIANIKRDSQNVKNCLKIIENLYSGWKQAVASLNKK